LDETQVHDLPSVGTPNIGSNAILPERRALVQLKALIDEAAAIAGSQNKLAAAMGVTSGNVSEWRSGARHCPDKHVLQMARIAGRPPVRTALEVYKERLGELAKTLAIGAAAIMLSFGGNDAAACAGTRLPTEPNV
jgi:DNA-binding transcriptional regulator YdaS (Cro superfamily)